MTDAVETPDGDDHFATLAGIIADAGEVGLGLARMQIAELRVLAAAGRSAQAQAQAQAVTANTRNGFE